MTDIIERLDACLKEIRNWSEWPHYGGLPCMEGAKAEIAGILREL